MNTDKVREAWISIPTEKERRAQSPPGTRIGSYDYGFVPAMGRLLATHNRIAPAFTGLFREVMHNSEFLSRQECEMIAAVTAAAQDCHY